MKKKINKRIPKYKFGAAEVSEAVSTTASGVAGAMGVSQGSPVGGAFKGIGAGLSAIPTPYTQIAGAALSTVGSFWGEDGSVDPNTGEIRKGSGLSKLFGRSNRSLAAESNRIKTSIADREMTEHLNYEYYSDPNNTVNANIFQAAEGGIMRKPVDALVSKGELIYNPVTKKLNKVPGSKGKPNKEDDVYARLSEGDVVISNSPTMLMANGKTPAQNLEGLVNSDKNIKAKEAIIKKVVNWQEANKTKPQQYAKYDTGTSYVQLGKDPIQKLRQELLKPQTPEITGKDPLKNLTKDQRAVLREAIKIQNGKSKTDWLSGLSDFVPMLSAFTKDYSYHTEPTYINPVQFMPVNVSTDPIRRATDEGMAIARYNQMNANPSTGAGIAHGLQAAVNRSKSLSDAYKWQQDAQNKLIAQNAGIYNDWASREAQARHTAATETAQNEAAARLMRDQAIKDAYEFQTGRRNDKWKLSMLKPMFEYAVDDKIWKNFKIA